MKLTKTDRVLKFKRSDWIKKCVDFNTKKRMNAVNGFEKYFFKLMINSVYGKTMKLLDINWKEIKVKNINEENMKLTKYVYHVLTIKDMC